VIVRLALRLLSELVHGKRSDIRAITAEALRALELYRWPGNIRELRNVLERAVALSPGPVLRVDDLPETLRIDDAQERHAVSATANGEPLPVRLRETNEEAEIRCIKYALEKHGNNRLRAAAELGISRMGLYKKLEKYGLK
jgi:DNA-binding NtrC family response regulator